MGNLKQKYTACIYGCSFMLGAVHAAMGKLLTYEIDYYKLDDASKGLPNGIMSGMTIAAFVVTMLLAGRVRKANLLRTALILGAAALLLMAVKLKLAAFLCLMAIAGLSGGLLDSVNSAIIAQLYPGKSGPMCIMHGLYGLAGLAMPFAYDAILKHSSLGWQGGYVLAGVCMLALCVSAFIVSINKLDILEGPVLKEDRISAHMLREVLGIKAMLPIYISLMLGGMYLNGMLMWVTRFIEFGHSAPKLEPYALGVVYFAILASRLIMSALKWDVLKYSKLALPAGVAALALAVFTKSAPFALVMVFVSTFCYGPMIPCTLSYAADLMPKRSFIITLSSLFVMMVGQTVYSPLFAIAESSWGVRDSMLIGAALLLGAWMALLFVKKNDNIA